MERIDESKNVQTTPTRTYCKHSRPLSYCNKNCRTPRHWKFTQHLRTTRPPPPGRSTIWMVVGHGPAALAVGAGGGCLDIFTRLYPLSPLSPSLWETARYRLKYCLKGPLNPKQPTNQLFLPLWETARYILKYRLKGPLNPKKQPTNLLADWRC